MDCCSLTASVCRITFFALFNVKFSSVCSLSDSCTSQIPTTNRSLINSFLVLPYWQYSESWYKLEIKCSTVSPSSSCRLLKRACSKITFLRTLKWPSNLASTSENCFQSSSVMLVDARISSASSLKQ